MLRFLLRLTPAFIVCSAANAQTPPAKLDAPGAPPSNMIGSPPIAPNSSRPAPKFKMPDGFGGLKEEEPTVLDSAPDQTGSTTARPNLPPTEPTDNGQP